MGVARAEVSMIAPELLTHLKEHVKEEAELSKNLRLAREERDKRIDNRKKKNSKKEED